MGDVLLFVVRVWRQHGGFRAAVRGGGRDEPRLFTTPEQVGAFLDQAVASADAGTGDDVKHRRGPEDTTSGQLPSGTKQGQRA